MSDSYYPYIKVKINFGEPLKRCKATFLELINDADGEQFKVIIPRPKNNNQT